MSIYDIEVSTISGEQVSLAKYQGKVLLLVNVASKCGLTKQYEELEALYKAKAATGFEILGFPCNQFLGQEPGTEAEIQQFCTLNYGVTFPMFAKIEVNGANRHPLYQALIAAQPSAIKNPTGGLADKLAEMKLLPETDSDILWNFEKFLIGADGQVLARFAPDVTVTSAEFTEVLDKVLA
ncbi:redoxin domain-containing protein [Shewanella avicenniae]|uniref:Glutathione peroxidase n=1 Tax=Shewanella avicenniae TaxID=2814294 RepID=A0ABX7QSG8_9GAMM|nr:redoxin domain-containing protein [Shewanella avicenniae]QSX34409.1 redoxin domain-containing protein [Shewanella avicenniae]